MIVFPVNYITLDLRFGNFEYFNMNNEPVKSNSKLYWILGGVVALVLVGSFMVIALAAGIFFYANSGSDRVPLKKNQKKLRQIKKLRLRKIVTVAIFSRPQRNQIQHLLRSLIRMWQIN